MLNNAGLIYPEDMLLFSLQTFYSPYNNNNTFIFRVFLLNGIDDQVDKHRGQSCIAIQVIPSDSLGPPEPMGQGTDTSAICSLKASHTFAWKWHPHGSGRDTLPVPEVTTDDLSTSWLISPAPAAM